MSGSGKTEQIKITSPAAEEGSVTDEFIRLLLLPALSDWRLDGAQPIAMLLGYTHAAKQFDWHGGRGPLEHTRHSGRCLAVGQTAQLPQTVKGSQLPKCIREQHFELMHIPAVANLLPLNRAS